MSRTGRGADELRPLEIVPGYLDQAHGSALISLGRTRVLCTATVEDGVPRWLAGKGVGWLTAEYGMLPASSGQRIRREASEGRQKGRTIEIQRLIGRAIRGAYDMKLLGERTVWLDCDVIQADGGTRTAAVSGAWVALVLAAQAPRLLAARGAGGRGLARHRRRASCCSTSTTRRTRPPRWT